MRNRTSAFEIRIVEAFIQQRVVLPNGKHVPKGIRKGVGFRGRERWDRRVVQGGVRLEFSVFFFFVVVIVFSERSKNEGIVYGELQF